MIQILVGITFLLLSFILLILSVYLWNNLYQVDMSKEIGQRNNLAIAIWKASLWISHGILAYGIVSPRYRAWRFFKEDTLVQFIVKLVSDLGLIILFFVIGVAVIYLMNRVYQLFFPELNLQEELKINHNQAMAWLLCGINISTALVYVLVF